MKNNLAYYQKGAWKAEWQVQKQRGRIAYLQSQGRDASSSAHQLLNMLIKRQQWYERKIECAAND
jgi:Tfp pilus assembly protein PilN